MIIEAIAIVFALFLCMVCAAGHQLTPSMDRAETVSGKVTSLLTKVMFAGGFVGASFLLHYVLTLAL